MRNYLKTRVVITTDWMATLYSPQNQAGVMSFYDAPTKGPKINPKLVLVAVMVFAVVILILDHVSYLA